jgi:hypothetical protein
MSDIQWTVTFLALFVIAPMIMPPAEKWKEWWCALFHGGGTVRHDEQSVYWECRKCKRKSR